MNIDRLKQTELFLFDMDGTIYLEDKVIDGALELLQWIKENKKEYVFLTNNSSKNVKSYLKKLKNLNIEADENNIFSSTHATVNYLNKHYNNSKMYLVGTNDLREELIMHGIDIAENHEEDDIEAVVVGFDTELTFNKLQEACKLISCGKKFIGTNMDLVCPIKGDMFIPDCQYICNMIKTATNIEPDYMGKPNKEIIEYLSEKFNTHKDKMAVVGDRLYTDIKLGTNAGITSICVLTGETKEEHINTSDIKPDYIFNSVRDIIDILR